MMRIAVVWFTCARDRDLLQVSLASFRSIKGITWSFHAAIDVKDEPTALPKDVQQIRTGFPRNGNLNGIDCVAGMLEVMQSVADNVDYVIKVDSDMIVRGTRWLTYLESRTWALVGGARDFVYAMGCWGGAYCLASKALQQLPDDLHALMEEANWFRYGKLAPRYPEDETVSAIFASLYPDHVLWVADSYPRSGWITRYCYNGNNSYWQHYDFVEFGGHQEQIHWTESRERNSPENLKVIAETMRVCQGQLAPDPLPSPIIGRNDRPYIGLYNAIGHFDYFHPVIKHFERQGRLIHYLSDRDLPDLENALMPCDVVFLWNGTTPTYRQVQDQCQTMGIDVVITEVGFFPPTDHVFLDRRGINSGSSLMADNLSWLTDRMRNEYQKFRRVYAPRHLSGDYVLVPLQLEDDSNIQRHSPIRNMQAFIDHCCEQFQGERIVFKRRPKDTKDYQTHGHQLIIDDLSVMRIAQHASLVYGINSTALLACALMEGLEVQTIGEGFLDKPEPRDDILAALFALQVHKHDNKIPEIVRIRLGV